MVEAAMAVDATEQPTRFRLVARDGGIHAQLLFRLSATFEDQSQEFVQIYRHIQASMTVFNALQEDTYDQDVQSCYVPFIAASGKQR